MENYKLMIMRVCRYVGTDSYRLQCSKMNENYAKISSVMLVRSELPHYGFSECG